MDYPLFNKTLRRLERIIDKIQRRIEEWKAELLSRGGRLTLVNVVLINIPLFYFFIFKAPK